MTKLQKITTSILSIFLCLLFIVSVVDTHEFRQKTNFDQERILAHVEKLSENGPRSVAHKEANAKAHHQSSAVVLSKPESKVKVLLIPTNEELMIAMETKEIILQLRTKNKLSQDELAEKVFVTRQAVSRWETGERRQGA